jgi:HJR/Mrr/RecB family endonuclease
MGKLNLYPIGSIVAGMEILEVLRVDGNRGTLYIVKHIVDCGAVRAETHDYLTRRAYKGHYSACKSCHNRKVSKSNSERPKKRRNLENSKYYQDRIEAAAIADFEFVNQHMPASQLISDDRWEHI